jgi:hypothetical protein
MAEPFHSSTFLSSPMPGKHGGPRPNSGRPSNAAKHEARLATFTDKVATHLPQAYKNLEALADGEAEGFEDEWKAAGAYTRKAVARNPDGTVVQDKNGKTTLEDVLCFPGLPPLELVMVGRKVRHLPPDFKANELMVERIGGKPRQAVELTGEDGGAVEHAVTIYLPSNNRDVKPDGNPPATGTPGGLAL